MSKLEKELKEKMIEDATEKNDHIGRLILMKDTPGFCGNSMVTQEERQMPVEVFVEKQYFEAGTGDDYSHYLQWLESHRMTEEYNKVMAKLSEKGGEWSCNIEGGKENVCTDTDEAEGGKGSV